MAHRSMAKPLRAFRWRFSSSVAAHEIVPSHSMVAPNLKTLAFLRNDNAKAFARASRDMFRATGEISDTTGIATSDEMEMMRLVRSTMWTQNRDVLDIFRRKNWPIDGHMYWRAMIQRIQRHQFADALTVYDDFVHRKKAAKTPVEKLLSPVDPDGRLYLLRIEALQRLSRWDEAYDALLSEEEHAQQDESQVLVFSSDMSERDKFLAVRELVLRRQNVDHLILQLQDGDARLYLRQEAQRLQRVSSQPVRDIAYVEARRASLAMMQLRHLVSQGDPYRCRALLGLVPRQFAVGNIVRGITQAGQNLELGRAEGLFKLFKQPPPAAIAAIIQARAIAAREALAHNDTDRHAMLVEASVDLFEHFDPRPLPNKAFTALTRMLAHAPGHAYKALSVHQLARDCNKKVLPIVSLELVRALDCDTAIALAIELASDPDVESHSDAIFAACRNAENEEWQRHHPSFKIRGPKSKLRQQLDRLADNPQLALDTFLLHFDALQHENPAYSRSDFEAIMTILEHHCAWMPALELLQMSRRIPPRPM